MAQLPTSPGACLPFATLHFLISPLSDLLSFHLNRIYSAVISPFLLRFVAVVRCSTSKTSLSTPPPVLAEQRGLPPKLFLLVQPKPAKHKITDSIKAGGDGREGITEGTTTAPT